MDKYKKKSLKFMGFSRDLRNEERNTQRALSRHQRFSLLRPLDEVENTPDQKQKECSSRIPMFGKPKAPAVMRVEMLQKWKQEKMMKKQQESKLKKPAFKVGVVEHKPPPGKAGKPLFAVDVTSSRLYKSRLQTSQFQSERNQSKLAKKPENNMSCLVNDNKMSHLQPQSKLANKPAISNTTSKMVPNNKNLKPPSTNKTVTPNAFESKLAKNKDSSALPSISNRARGLPVSVDSKNKNKQEQPSIAKKQPVPISKLKEPSKESCLQSSNIKTKTNVTVLNDVKSKISSGLRKPANFRILPKVPEQVSQTDISKKNTSRVQDVKSNQKGIPVKNNVAKNIPIRPGAVISKLKDPVFEKGNKSEKKGNEFEKKGNEIEKKGNETEKKGKETVKEENEIEKEENEIEKEENETEKEESVSEKKEKGSEGKAKDNCVNEDSGIPFLSDSKNITFRCEISYIEPVEDVRKSFAPDGFVFRPPIELNSSLFLDDGPSSIFTRMKSEQQRTSTPKQNAVNQQQEPKKDIADDNVVSSEHKNDPGTSSLSSTLNSVFTSVNNVLEEPFMAVQKDELQSSKVSSTQEPTLIEDSDTSLENNLEKSENTFFFDALEKDTVEATTKNDQYTSEKLELLTIEDINPSNTEKLQNLKNDQDCPNGFVPVKNNGLTSNYELRTRNFRRSEKPALESINESLETEKTPISSRKKPILNKDFTPRRSVRLAKLSCESSSLENLLDIRRPTLFGTPEKDEISSKPCHSGLTYDFEKLELEDCSQFRAAHPRKVSLLYTPPHKGKPSICKKSLNGDLMSFSPSM